MILDASRHQYGDNIIQNRISKLGMAFLEPIFWQNIRQAACKVDKYDFVRAMKATGRRNDLACEQIYQEIAADLDQFIQNFDDLIDLCSDFNNPQF